MEQLKFIDTHAHLARECDSKVLDRLVESGTLRQVWMLALECYQPNVHAGNREVLELGMRYPGVFIPFGFIDFSQGAEQIDHLKESGFIGLKAIRPQYNYDDERYFPIYQRAEELRMPILFHVGIISKRTRQEILSNSCLGPTHMHPAMLDGISAAFPKLKLIQGHMGIPWSEELFESLFYYPNIYCSVCGLIDYRWLIDNLDRRDCEGTPFYHKLMYGLDSLYGVEQWEKEIIRNAEFFADFFKKVGRTFHWGDHAEDFLYNNAYRFINEFLPDAGGDHGKVSRIHAD